jgi:prepilin-type N-terminal cleavage/methylation domain-containing protein
VRRAAFTMIELIFAIVIMSVVVFSIPIVLRTNMNATEGNILQEAVFAASAKMMQVLSYPWDINSTDRSGATKIVAIPGGTNAFRRYYDAYNDINQTSGNYRIGGVIQNGHRRFHNYTDADTNVTKPLTTGGDTALNNISGTDIAFYNSTTSAQGYKNNYSVDVNVSYIPDNVFDANGNYIFSSDGDNTPSNMKLITVDIHDLNKVGKPIIVKLRAYSANIGEVTFAQRTF